MDQTFLQALGKNFLGSAPDWYKQTIVCFLVLNPLLLFTLGPFITGWVLIAEFIFTLAMALKCYPLQPGGLLALEAALLGMTTPQSIFTEVEGNLEVILLLVFMVAGIYFMRSLLLFVFTKLLIGVRSKVFLSFLFCLVSAFLSAFLDALTVTAVLITVAVGFYSVYHKVASGGSSISTGNRSSASKDEAEHDSSVDDKVTEFHRADLDAFRAFMRSLIMHGAVGTALGGVCTLVGEPQNLLIAQVAGWNFTEFFVHMAPISMPVLVAGLSTCMLLEKFKLMGYGEQLPPAVRQVLENFAQEEEKRRSSQDTAELVVQAVVACILIAALALHLAEVGLIGLLVIVLLTALNGVVDEHQVGRAFGEALPFTALLVVFFAIVAVIHDQHLFSPIIHYVLSMDTSIQPIMFFISNGVLSMISDNVFVATIYISEVKMALELGEITREHFDKLAIAINTGTNLPSVATPNGQAAFLFLLTSALAPLIRLSYGKMVLMALPYTIVLSAVGLLMVYTQL
jgi:NhaB family Na+:H+ antiporter